MLFIQGHSCTAVFSTILLKHVCISMSCYGLSDCHTLGPDLNRSGNFEHSHHHGASGIRARIIV